MKKLIVAVLSLAVGLCASAGSLRITSTSTGVDGTVTVTLAGAAAAGARPVYAVWGDADLGEDYAVWERTERVGTLAAGETAISFALPKASQYATAFRFFLFTGEQDGDGYLDAVRADKDQYINTGVKPTKDASCYADFKLNDKTDAQQRVFGVGPSGNADITCQAYINSNGNWAYSFKDGGGDWISSGIAVNTSDRVQMLLDRTRNLYRLCYNGVIKKSTSPISSSCTKDGSSPMGVMTHLTGNSRYSNTNYLNKAYSRMDFYSFTMRNHGVTVVNLKPYIKDGVACMYDSAQKKHLYSGTSTAFTAVERIGNPVASVALCVTVAAEAGQTVESDEIVGPVAVRVNNGTSGGGTVKMNPRNSYTGVTFLSCGTLWASEFLSDVAGPLGAKAALFMGPGTLYFPAGKGTFNGDVFTRLDYGSDSAAGDKPAAVFDIAEGGDLTLAGAFTNPKGGAFIKKGPGVLRIPGAANQTNTLVAGGGYTGALALKPLKFNANGDSPVEGYSGFCIAEGTVVLGENGGVFNINATPDDVMLGTMTKDPVRDAGQQETAGVLEVRGGTVTINNWLGMGAKNGFVTTTPDYVPSSGIRVYGGKVYAKASCGMGRNKNAVPQQDEYGQYIPMRTCPFIEVHGGEFQIWDTSRFSPCDDAGADARILVDGGMFALKGTVTNGAPTTSAAMRIGNCGDGAVDTPSHADITVRDGGTLEMTTFYIVNNRKNVTVDFKVLDGGIARWNEMKRNNTKGGCSMNVLFDGGVTPLRYAGYANWIASDVDSFRIGTRGMTFTTGTDCNTGVRNNINITLAATNSYPGEVAQGVKIMAPSDKNSGFRFMKPQAWDGPTVIAAYGLCDFGGEGALPPESPVTLEAKGRLIVTNAPQTFASLTLGGAAGGKAMLYLQKETPITARDGLTVRAGTTVSFVLYGTKGSTEWFAEDGTYDLIYAPAANAAALRRVANGATCYNPADGKTYKFAVAVSGETAALTVTVADPAEPDVLTYTDADPATIVLDEPQTKSGVTFESGDHALTGKKLTLDNGGSAATVDVKAGSQTIAAPLAAGFDLVLATVEGTSLTVSGGVEGARKITTNPTATGGGMVDLGASLAGFGGALSVGSGTTKITDLSFAANVADALTLGRGTLWYAGAPTTIAGLVVNPEGNNATVLRVDDALTLTGVSAVSGSLMKKGVGDLIFKGNGEFRPGTGDSSFARSAKDSVKPNGDAPTACTKNVLVSEGRLIVGTKDDPEDAPQVFLVNTFGVGCRSTVEQDERPETTGEFILNNGTFTVPDYTYLGFYNGTPYTDPQGLLNPKITINGGVFNSKAIRLYHDGNGNMLTCSPTLEVNGGEVNLSGVLEVAYSPNKAATSVDPACTVAVTGGTVTVGSDLNIGNAAEAPRSVTTVGGTGTLIVKGNVNLSKSSTQKPQLLYLEEGGTLVTKGMIVHGAGTSEIHFRGGVWKPGFGRNRGTGYTFGNSSDAAKRHTHVYIGKGGLKLDFSEWQKAGSDGAGMELCQPFEHDPDCEGEDGGIEFSGRNTSIIRTSCSTDSNFNGPMVAKNGFAIGVDNGWKGFKTVPITVKPGSSLRASGDYMYINRLTLGEEDGTEPVRLDNCTTIKGLVVSNELAILSPVTLAFHRNGGQSNINGIKLGTFDMLIYPASLDGNVPLDKFVANPAFPEVTMTFAKASVTSGAYSGWKKVVATVKASGAASDTWISAAGGGAWFDGKNWQGEDAVPANATNALVKFTAATAAAVPVTVAATPTAGQLTLAGSSAANGYTFSGAPINLNHSDFFTPPAVVAESGSHEFAGGLQTDDEYARSNETYANGGYSGAIRVNAKTGAKVTLSGPVTTDPKRELFVNNPELKNGGTTVIAAPVSTKEVRVESGTVEIGDFSDLGGKKLFVGAATLHYTGPDASTDSAIETKPGSNLVATVVNLDHDLAVRGAFTSTSGSLVKRGPGELRLLYPGAVSLGYEGKSGATGVPGWNAMDKWPENGDSLVTSTSPFYFDEGTVTVGCEGQTCTLGMKGSPDLFLGCQPRTGWAYTDKSNKVVFNFMGGALNGYVVGMQHGMRRGSDPTTQAGGTDRCWFEYNQYGGNASFSNVYLGYELTTYDNHCLASMNLYGGTFKASNLFRFGQTHCQKAGVNEPHATVNIYDGATFWQSSGNWVSRITYMSYAAGTGDLKKHQNKSEDATLNMYGGAYTNTYFFLVGCNGSVARLNLHGGVLGCENVIHQLYEKGVTDNTTNHVYNVPAGKAYIYWNGGEFHPYAQMLDPWASEARNATLQGLTEVVVSTNGAKVSTAELRNSTKLYTIAQPLLHSADVEVDGGLEKLGANTLALSGANGYNGPTVVSEGTLYIPDNADESAIPTNSLVSVAEGAVLEFGPRSRAAVKNLLIDMRKSGGAIRGLHPAKRGNLYLTNAEGIALDDVIPNIAIDGVVGASKLSRWNVYVNGALKPEYGLYVKDGWLTVGPHATGATVIIR